MVNLISEILQEGYLMSLGTTDKGGVWVADVIYVFDKDLNIYWISDPDCRHSSAIRSNKNVAGTITISKKARESDRGLQISGEALEIRGPLFEFEKLHAGKRGKTLPKNPGEILEGDFWYKLTPNFIEIIDKNKFGFEKKKIQLR